MPQVRAIVRDARDHEYRFSALVRGIVRSDAFLKGRSEPIQKPEAKGAAAATVTRAD